MPYFADFYFYKNTPMDPNEVNFFNTGGNNKEMADELLLRLREYKVGVEYNSKVPFNPTATEIYINAFLNGGSGTPTIDDILAIDYMIVKAYDLHNRVHQEYKYFAYFVESIEPYMQTFPTDGLEDTGVKAAFGYSYRVKLKKDTFVTDFIFSTAKINLDDLNLNGAIIKTITPCGSYNKYNLGEYANLTDFHIGSPDRFDFFGNVSTIIGREQANGTNDVAYGNTREKFKVDFLEYDKNAANYYAVGVYVNSESEKVSYASSFLAVKAKNYGTDQPYFAPVTLSEAISDALDFMQVGRMDISGTTPKYKYIELKNVYIFPSFIVNKIIAQFSSGDYYSFQYQSGENTWAKKFSAGTISTQSISNASCGVFSLTKALDARKNGYFGFEALNVNLLAGRQKIKIPQIIFEKNEEFEYDRSRTKILLSANAFGISIKLGTCGNTYDVTDEYSMPVISAAAAEIVQKDIAKTSGLLSGIISVIGGVAASVSGVATGNIPAGVAGVGAVVGGATSIAQSNAIERDQPGAVSVTGGNADCVSALMNGFIRFEYESAPNGTSIINSIARYGYFFNNQIQCGYLPYIFTPAKNNNFLYMEADVEKIHDLAGGLPKNFKTWLIERMKNGIKIFYTFDAFFDKDREDITYYI